MADIFLLCFFYYAAVSRTVDSFPRLSNDLTAADTCVTPGQSLPHELDCHRFYLCDVDGHLFLDECPDQLLYDLLSHNCNDPWAVDCAGRVNPYFRDQDNFVDWQLASKDVPYDDYLEHPWDLTWWTHAEADDTEYTELPEEYSTSHRWDSGIESSSPLFHNVWDSLAAENENVPDSTFNYLITTAAEIEGAGGNSNRAGSLPIRDESSSTEPTLDVSSIKSGDASIDPKADDDKASAPKETELRRTDDTNDETNGTTLERTTMAEEPSAIDTTESVSIEWNVSRANVDVQLITAQENFTENGTFQQATAHDLGTNEVTPTTTGIPEDVTITGQNFIESHHTTETRNTAPTEEPMNATHWDNLPLNEDVDTFFEILKYTPENKDGENILLRSMAKMPVQDDVSSTHPTQPSVEYTDKLSTARYGSSRYDPQETTVMPSTPGSNPEEFGKDESSWASSPTTRAPGWIKDDGGYKKSSTRFTKSEILTNRGLELQTRTTQVAADHHSTLETATEEEDLRKSSSSTSRQFSYMYEITDDGTSSVDESQETSSKEQNAKTSEESDEAVDGMFCVWRANVRCIYGQEAMHVNPWNCKMSFFCFKRQTYFLECPKDLLFDINSLSCIQSAKTNNYAGKSGKYFVVE